MKKSNKMKCPKCGSTDVKCMDGKGAVSAYGRGVMIDIAPEIWLCGACKEMFRIDGIDFGEGSDKYEA